METDVARELPPKIKVADPNCRVFDQVVKYKWIIEYCLKCIQVGHKCHVKEEIKNKGVPRMVQK